MKFSVYLHEIMSCLFYLCNIHSCIVMDLQKRFWKGILAKLLCPVKKSILEVMAVRNVLNIFFSIGDNFLEIPQWNFYQMEICVISYFF